MLRCVDARCRLFISHADFFACRRYAFRHADYYAYALVAFAYVDLMSCLFRHYFAGFRCRLMFFFRRARLLMPPFILRLLLDAAAAYFRWLPFSPLRHYATLTPLMDADFHAVLLRA